MKAYPSVPKTVESIPVYAFDKLDGSNLRAEWSRKNGFYKYGTRHRLLSETDEILGTGIQLINDIYGNELSKRLKDARIDSAVCYFEFYGPNSFAGVHDKDDTHDVVFFDVSFYKKGFLSPKDFMAFADGLNIPDLLYRGNPNQPFINSVIDGSLSGMTGEGVVCKYVKKKLTRMFKIKSKNWLDRLRKKCGDDDKLFNELS